MRATIAFYMAMLCVLPCCGGSDDRGNSVDAGAGTGASGGSGGSGGAASGGAAGAAGSATGGSGGSGGSAPDGGAGSAGDGGGGTCSACVVPALTWGNDGGRVAYRDSSLLDCVFYRHARENFSDPNASLRCEQPVACSAPSGVSVESVVQALAHADVTAAFARAPVTYGQDQRPVDGQVLVLTRQGKSVTVGADCGSGSGCEAIPAGIKALEQLLRTLDDEQLAKEPCASSF